MVTEISKMCHRKTESTKLSLVTITMTLRLCIHDIFLLSSSLRQARGKLQVAYTVPWRGIQGIRPW